MIQIFIINSQIPKSPNLIEFNGLVYQKYLKKFLIQFQNNIKIILFYKQIEGDKFSLDQIGNIINSKENLIKIFKLH